MHFPTTLIAGALFQSSVIAKTQPAQDVLAPASSYSHLHLTHDLLAFHKNLTQIESISGNEHDVGVWLTESLQSQGYTVEKQSLGGNPPRFNLLAWPGGKRNTRVLLSSHIDTVPPFWPYTHNASTGVIIGRGSVDAKGSVATQVLALNGLLESREVSPDDVGLLFVVGEETGGDGMRAANDLNLKPKSIIFGEPTEGRLCAGHKGNLGAKIIAKGKAAHSGYPWLGRSANEVLVAALGGVMEMVKGLPTSEKYGSTTMNIGRMEGGVAANVVPESASASLAFRLAEGTPETLKPLVVEAVENAVAAFVDKDVKASDVVEIIFTSAGYGPIAIDSDVPGFGKPITVNYGTDIPNLKQTVKGQKRYLYGPGSILVAHSDHEATTEKELFDAVDGYKTLILHAMIKDDAREQLRDARRPDL
ncbi:hypothetical protein B0A48_07144 [Cryoendolithus antarcticus]|uniref:Peptidase M20 dimerisation domain-containing protein n=1 Tax=Cryoendolithus antarcticus TaxID=1507870 RepID=A0A1V8T7Q4_9PEZI|nr:hypothetical protein B0A48_07144 [Cryoendolithus antarcticus]